MVYLVVTNKDVTAAFSSLLKASGIDGWPNKEVYGRWDLTRRPVREIAPDTMARLRVAQWQLKALGEAEIFYTASTPRVCEWLVYIVTSFGHREVVTSTARLEFEMTANPAWLSGRTSG